MRRVLTTRCSPDSSTTPRCSRPATPPMPDAVAAHRAHRTPPGTPTWSARCCCPPARRRRAARACARPGPSGAGDRRWSATPALTGLPHACVRWPRPASPCGGSRRRSRSAARTRYPALRRDLAGGSTGARPPRYLEVPADRRARRARSTLVAARAGWRRRQVPHRRAGGRTRSPSEAELAAVVAACAGPRLPFKLTAGLHHAVRHLDPETGFEQHGFAQRAGRAPWRAHGGGPRRPASPRCWPTADAAARLVEPALDARRRAERDRFRSGSARCRVDGAARAICRALGAARTEG